MEIKDLTEAQKSEVKTLTDAGISEEVAKFVSVERGNRVLNSEGLEIGNKLKLKAISETVNSGVITGQDGVRKWVTILTTGDAESVSISRLVGTAKRAKYFNTERGEDVELKDGLDMDKVLALPRREVDALVEVAKNYLGKTLEVVGIARNCGQFQQTFYLFQVID